MKWYYAILAIFVAAVAFFFIGRLTAPLPQERVRIERDTLIIRETLTTVRPVPQLVRVIDTLRIYCADTMHRTDTVVASLPIEQKIYSDSSYRAVISGVQASLDSISVYPRTMVVSERVERVIKRRWTLGASVGFGAFYGLSTRKVDCGPGIMLGVTYNF